MRSVIVSLVIVPMLLQGSVYLHCHAHEDPAGVHHHHRQPHVHLTDAGHPPHASSTEHDHCVAYVSGEPLRAASQRDIWRPSLDHQPLADGDLDSRQARLASLGRLWKQASGSLSLHPASAWNRISPLLRPHLLRI